MCHGFGCLSGLYTFLTSSPSFMFSWFRGFLIYGLGSSGGITTPGTLFIVGSGVTYFSTIYFYSILFLMRFIACSTCFDFKMSAAGTTSYFYETGCFSSILSLITSIAFLTWLDFKELADGAFFLEVFYKAEAAFTCIAFICYST